MHNITTAITAIITLLHTYIASVEGSDEWPARRLFSYPGYKLSQPSVLSYKVSHSLSDSEVLPLPPHGSFAKYANTGVIMMCMS